MRRVSPGKRKSACSIQDAGAKSEAAILLRSLQILLFKRGRRMFK
jgi:hypothetical protein